MYIAIVSEFDLIIEVSDCFLAHQSIMVLLNRWAVEVSEHLSEISIAISSGLRIPFRGLVAVCWWFHDNPAPLGGVDIDG